jgi:hypothetical protein
MALAVVGLVFLGQGLAKALDPVGYMSALEAFRLSPAALGPLALGSLALSWTALELLSGVAILYGGLARSPAMHLTAAAIVVATGLSCASLILDLGGLARHLPLPNGTIFREHLPARFSWLALALLQAALIAVLAWLFARVSTWSSARRVARRMRGRGRALSHA